MKMKSQKIKKTQWWKRLVQRKEWIINNGEDLRMALSLGKNRDVLVFGGLK